MVLRLAAVLDVPLREQNQLLLAAGLAPVYGERSLDDPDMAAVREGVERVLNAYNPFPCVVVDRGWQIVHANAGAGVLLEGVAPIFSSGRTRCASPCIRRGWRRASATLPSGDTI